MGWAGTQRAFGVEPAPDGGCVIAGTTASESDVDGFVARLDAEGREPWTHRIDGPGMQVAYHLRPAREGSFVMTGYDDAAEGRDADVHVLKFAARGGVWVARLEVRSR